MDPLGRAQAKARHTDLERFHGHGTARGLDGTTSFVEECDAVGFIGIAFNA